MATRTAHIVEPLLWRAPLSAGETTLADAIREKIAVTRAHLLDFIKLDEAPPHHALTLTEWQRPAELRSLLATYSDHIYRNQTAVIPLGTVVYRADGAACHAGPVDPGNDARSLVGTFPC